MRNNLIKLWVTGINAHRFGRGLLGSDTERENLFGRGTLLTDCLLVEGCSMRSGYSLYL